MIDNLPTQLTHFVGREQEAADIQQLLTEARLLTLAGPGGGGKTRLAIEVAATLADAYPDGIFWVELAPLTDGELVAPTVAAALNVRDQPGDPLDQVMASCLADKRLLLLLDNCEHIIDACATLVDALLRTCPHLQCLATSREPLGVSGEVVYSVPPLALPEAELLPEPGGPPVRPDTDLIARLAQVESVSLFVDRAASILPGFALTADNARPIARICRRLDGIPLAIELASARVNVLSLAQIGDRLEDRFGLLVSAQRTAVKPHHQTMRAAIDWSYDLLKPEEQTLLHRLAIFEAGCNLDMAEAVCSGGGIGQAEVLDLLSSLVTKSLLLSETVGRAQARYRLLDTIREYSLEKLTASGEEARLRDRHLDWFVERVEGTTAKLHGPYQQLWLAWLGGENDNLRAALRWALDSGRIEAGLRLAAALYDFWLRRGYLREGRTWSRRLLAQADDQTSPLLRAKVNTTLSHFSWSQGDYQRARETGRVSIELARSAGDEGKPYLARLLMGHSSTIRSSGDFAAAFDLCAQSIHMLREFGDAPGLVPALILQGVNATALGNYELAQALIGEGLALARELEDQLHIGLALKVQGDLAYCQQDYGRAQVAYEQGLAHYRASGRAWDNAGIQCSLGHAYLQLGELPRARELLVESLETQQSAGNTRGLAECLLGLGALASVQDQPKRAVRLLAAAVTQGGRGMLYSTPAQHKAYEQYLATAQAALPAAAFALAQQTGQGLTMEQAIELALDVSATVTPPQSEPGGLTPRQLEVAGLITQGKTNGEIAADLVLSKRTVEKHVANILARLDLTNRAEVVRWGMEQGLA
ncbi:MAG: LuxR C-terminal-related transcriptional regulator [Anaerolineae bacterium]